MTSGAPIARAPAVAPCAAAPSLSCSTSSEGDSFYLSSDLLEEGRVAAEGADHRKLQRLAKELLGDSHEVISGDGIDLRHVLINPLDSAGEGFLPAVPGRHRVGAFHLQQQPALVELFGLRQLRTLHRFLAEPPQLADDRAYRTRGLTRLGSRVDAEHPGVEHFVDVGVDVVRQPQLLAYFDEH